MKKIVHISDLHFGRTDKRASSSILDIIDSLSPDLTVVSGDLTQRARSSQFAQASDFLEKIDSPKIVIPGNHDISLHNFYKRFFKPLKAFTVYISDEEYPLYVDDEIAFIGVNSARSLAFKNGRLRSEQIKHVKKIFRESNPDLLRGIVIHHNFIPQSRSEEASISNGPLFFDEITSCGVDVILCGHHHHGSVAHAEHYYAYSGSTLVISAGTAISRRVRGEPNSFNYLELEEKKIFVRHYEFTQGKFKLAGSHLFLQKNTAWQKI